MIVHCARPTCPHPALAIFWERQRYGVDVLGLRVVLHFARCFDQRKDSQLVVLQVQLLEVCVVGLRNLRRCGWLADLLQHVEQVVSIPLSLVLVS